MPLVNIIGNSISSNNSKSGLPPEYIFRIDTTLVGSTNNDQYKIRCVNPVTVNWGDGNTQNITGDTIHTYDTPGQYDISITGALVDIYNYDNTDKLKIIAIVNWGTQQIGGLELAFRDCTNLTSLPLRGGPTSNSQYLYSMFRDTSITNISIGLFDNCTNARTMNELFMSCPITDIPVDLFRYNILVTTFDKAFSNTLINDIPTDIFKYNSLVDNFDYCFTNCLNLTTTGIAIFKDHTLSFSAVGVYDSCSNITIVGDELFCNSGINNTVDEVDLIFPDTILYIGNSVFKDCINLTDVSYMFQYCGNIVTIGNSLFEGCTNLVSIQYVINNSSNGNIESIGNNMFKGCVNILDVSYLFDGLTLLHTIGNSTFEDCSSLLRANYLFSIALNNIPIDLFKGCVSLTEIIELCSSPNITSIPNGLFDDVLSISDCSYAFTNLENITSAVPTLWIDHPTAIHTGCFEGCYAASNYASIPNDWKGL